MWCACSQEIFDTSLIVWCNHAMQTVHETRVRKHPAYWVWISMLQRCRNPKSTSYPHYGGRGIKVCERWLKFKNFVMDMPPRPSMKHSLNRIDNDGDYTPENCSWADDFEQCQNKRYHRLITINGKTQCLSAWVDELDLRPHYHRIRARIYSRKWSDLDALMTPFPPKGKRLKKNISPNGVDSLFQ